MSRPASTYEGLPLDRGAWDPERTSPVASVSAELAYDGDHEFTQDPESGVTVRRCVECAGWNYWVARCCRGCGKPLPAADERSDLMLDDVIDRLASGRGSDDPPLVVRELRVLAERYASEDGQVERLAAREGLIVASWGRGNVGVFDPDDASEDADGWFSCGSVRHAHGSLGVAIDGRYVVATEPRGLHVAEPGEGRGFRRVFQPAGGESIATEPILWGTRSTYARWRHGVLVGLRTPEGWSWVSVAIADELEGDSTLVSALPAPPQAWVWAPPHGVAWMDADGLRMLDPTWSDARTLLSPDQLSSTGFAVGHLGAAALSAHSDTLHIAARNRDGDRHSVAKLTDYRTDGVLPDQTLVRISPHARWSAGRGAGREHYGVEDAHQAAVLAADGQPSYEETTPGQGPAPLVGDRWAVFGGFKEGALRESELHLVNFSSHAGYASADTPRHVVACPGVLADDLVWRYPHVYFLMLDIRDRLLLCRLEQGESKGGTFES